MTIKIVPLELHNGQQIWVEVEAFDTAINFATGFAFDGVGVGFVTANEDLYSIDIENGVSGIVGQLGGPPYQSSGDCVVNKFNTLFMTSRHTSGEDTLVSIDRATAVTTELGPIGFDEVFGLTFAYGKLYGMTRAGDLIDIDPNTGAGTLLKSFTGLSWYGSASTPNR